MLLRHGKANVQALNQSDFQRPLKKHSDETIHAVADTLMRHFGHPDKVFSSPALRTRSTAEIFLRRVDADIAMDTPEELYAADVEDILQLLAGLPEELDQIMIVGHNPSLEEIIYTFSHHYQRLKTAHCCVLDLDIQGWPEVYGRVELLDEILIKP